jgi:hypothetical protein
MSTKHTAGSWQHGLPADGGRINVYSDDSAALRICRVDSDADFGNHAAANARLIAAAPEMLEALRLAEQALPYPAPGQNQRAINARRAVQAAIAKAEAA